MKSSFYINNMAGLSEEISYISIKSMGFLRMSLQKTLNVINDVASYVINKNITIRFELRGTNPEDEADFLIIFIPWRRTYEIKLDDDDFYWSHFSLNELRAISAKLNFYLKTHSLENVSIYRQAIYFDLEDEIEAHYWDLNNSRAAFNKKNKSRKVISIKRKKKEEK
jgi:hypothetical protein